MEQLKHTASSTTEELLYIINELNGYKSENTALNDAVQRLEKELTKLENEDGVMFKNNKQLKLINDTQKHQFNTELEKLQNKHQVNNYTF